ncbi:MULTISPECIES: TetR/AcrR family transcriptional regulator [Ferrimonas]|uniref:TetR/AcrR family transcriptional regulator n=1 Tax=Ferrimonas TaxID=44011 RepID=UPI0003FDD324|nr:MULTISPECIES: TetR/AcrR family transcriptional regulator [Ferrimonas]USD39517.1 TetR family transcriptional regulator [Ferrimonas sp. SCSIO 43195]
MGTRERILETSLALFNHQGSGNVTSLDIAAELEISPGNLYYHYKGKEEIIAQLFKECELAVGKLLARLDLDAISEQEYWVFLNSLLRVCLHYRFLFLDFQAIEQSTVGNRGNQRLIKQLRNFTAHSLSALQKKNLVEMSAQQRFELADNLFLLGLSWLCFETTLGPEKEEEEMVRTGANRLMSLVSPYLKRQLNFADSVR